jgi:hypothetical protein
MFRSKNEHWLYWYLVASKIEWLKKKKKTRINISNEWVPSKLKKKKKKKIKKKPKKNKY